MKVSRQQFEDWMAEAIDNMPEKFRSRINNLAFFVQDHPSAEQLGKVKAASSTILLGLYEGYHQSKRLNTGPVLPDRITLFQKPIEGLCHTEEELKKRIARTVYHEIAHHFGSDEKGARKVG